MCVCFCQYGTQRSSYWVFLLAHVTDRVSAHRTGKEAASHADEPLDRALCITAALFGISAFFFVLRTASNPLGPQPGWALPVGIVCLLVGLTSASLLIWRGRWR
jgi:hypothetical protein